MSSPSMLPILVSPIDKDASLEAALSRMVAADGRTLASASDTIEAIRARVAPRPENDDEDDPHVTAVRRLPAVAAEYAAMPEGIDRRLVAALRARGITELYTHQAEAIVHALAGRHTVVVTPTASGKTLCYNLPVLDAIAKDPSSRALYIFPTKALSQDQLAELERESGDMDIELKTYTYDGDTPPAVRAAIRSAGHVVITNPD